MSNPNEVADVDNDFLKEIMKITGEGLHNHHTGEWIYPDNTPEYVYALAKFVAQQNAALLRDMLSEVREIPVSKDRIGGYYRAIPASILEAKLKELEARP
jgi:hypothetical protein